MIVSAHVPGKLVILGEYAVLAGSQALVMAVDRYCHAEVGPSGGGVNYLRMVAPDRTVHEFAPGEAGGVGIVDLVLETVPCERPWRGVLDTSSFFVDENKLGLGSSAAALTAWSAAYTRFADLSAEVSLGGLIDLHRRFQGGAGSGIDVAASLFGGLIEYRLESGVTPSARKSALPDGIHFKVVFSGSSAGTRRLVKKFDLWRESNPADFEVEIASLTRIASQGCAAAQANDGAAFLAAVADYGRALQALGGHMGADLVTVEHLKILRHSDRCGVVYKISGAGGGDLGIAFSDDPGALAAFGKAAGEAYKVMDMAISYDGLVVEEHALD